MKLKWGITGNKNQSYTHLSTISLLSDILVLHLMIGNTKLVKL